MHEARCFIEDSLSHVVTEPSGVCQYHPEEHMGGFSLILQVRGVDGRRKLTREHLSVVLPQRTIRHECEVIVLTGPMYAAQVSPYV